MEFGFGMRFAALIPSSKDMPLSRTLEWWRSISGDFHAQKIKGKEKLTWEEER